MGLVLISLLSSPMEHLRYFLFKEERCIIGDSPFTALVNIKITEQNKRDKFIARQFHDIGARAGPDWVISERLNCNLVTRNRKLQK